MSTIVLLNLLNVLRKSENVRLANHFITISNKFNKLNNTGAFMLNTIYHMGINTRNLSSGFVNNKGADQPVHRLISTFVIRLIESITSKLASSEISIF